jgi:transcription initiation factor TFIIE subunit alpha
VSARATPSASAPASSEYGDLNNDEEEEQKPSVEYLDSLNDYRKRSRSRENEGVKRTKQAKLEDEHVNGFAPGPVQPNGFTDARPVADEELSPAPLMDDPIVYGTFITLHGDMCSHYDIIVNGAPVPFSEITEEHHELMTPDEYTAYFDILQERSAI